MTMRGPRTMAWLWGALIALAAIYLTLTATMSLAQGTTREVVRAANPGLAADELTLAIVLTVVGVAVVHAIHLLLLLWLLRTTQRGRPWARIVLSIYLPAAVIASMLAFGSMPYAWAVIPANLLHVAMLILLWPPRMHVRATATRSLGRGLE